jgi:hypothetical protein
MHSLKINMEDIGMRGIIPVLLATVMIPMSAVAKPLNTRHNEKPAYCYYNSNNLTWKIGNDALEAVIHFNKLSNSLTPILLRAKRGPMRLETPVQSAAVIQLEPGDQTLTLNRDWAFSWQTVLDTTDGGRILTVHLEGIASNEGWAIEEKYQVGPGASPWIANYFTLINPSKKNATVNSVTFSGWKIVPQKKSIMEPRTNALYISDTGLIRQGDFNISQMIACKINPHTELSRHGGRYYSPCAILTFTDKEKGATLALTQDMDRIADGD